MAGGAELELNEEQFNYIYHDYKVLEGKGALKIYALCKADQETYSKYTCKMPFGGEVEYNFENFVKKYQHLSTPNWKPRYNCMRMNLMSILDKHLKFWRCWNGYFWRYHNNKNGEYLEMD